MPLVRRPVRIRWWIFAFMYAFAMLAYVQRTSINIAAERIEPELHLSQLQVGVLMWAFTVTYTLMQVPAGVFGQRFGARLTYVLLGLVGFVATIVTPVAPALLSGGALFLMLVLAQAILGLSQAPVFPVFAGVVESWFPPNKWAIANGLQTSGMNIGAAITPPLIVLLTQSFGWQGALLWIAVPTGALTLLWGWYGRNTPREHPAVTPAELAELGSLPAEPPAPLTFDRLVRIASDRNVLLLAFSYMTMNYVFYLLTNWPFLYLVQERHFSALQGGFLAMLPPIGAAVGAASGGFISDRLAERFGARRGYRLVPLISLPLVGVLLLVATHVDSPYLAVAALTIAFAATEITEGPYWAATMQVARADTMAATGVLNTGGNFGGVVGIPIVAYLSDHGAWNAAFATGTAFALVAAACWLLIDPSRRAVTAAPAAGLHA